MMEIKTTHTEVYNIIKRFYNRYKLRRNPSNPNPNIFSNHIHDITLIKIYKRSCIYSNAENSYKENLVIKYKYKNANEIISLNIPWDNYKDLLS